MSLSTAATASPYSGMNLKTAGRSYQLTWNADRHQLLAHHAKLSQFLDQIQNSSQEPRPDICIMLNNQSIVLLHSEIGLAHSGFLRRRYATEMTMQNRPAVLNINLINYDPIAINRMVNFFYTGKLPCSLAEIPELLALCAKLQVTSMRLTIEKFIIQKAAEPNCLLDCWNISCNWQSDLSTRTKDFVLSYVMQNLEEAVLDPRFSELDQGAVETLLRRESLPIRTEADVLRIALMYFIRRQGQTNTQSLLNVVRYNCNESILVRMRNDILSVNDEVLRHCFEQNCAYGIWQLTCHSYFKHVWPEPEILPPRGKTDVDCSWIDAQFAHLVSPIP